jgi:NitT/TauT family transport system substrate-binding protein
MPAGAGLSRREVLKGIGGTAAGTAAFTTLGTLAAACGSSAPSGGGTKTGGKLTPVTLQLNYINNIEFSGMLWGAHKGFYRDEGIDITIEPLGPTSDAISIVASGKATVGMASGDQLIIAKSKGLPVKAFATQLQTNPNGWLALAKSGINSTSDFKGKSFGIPPFLRNQMPLVLSLVGLTESDVEIKPISFSLAPLLQQNVELYNAYEMNQPNTLKDMHIPYKFFRWADEGYVYYTDVFFATDTQVSHNAPLLKSFWRATQRGWMDVFASPAPVVSYVVSGSKGSLNAHQQTEEFHSLKPLMTSADTAAHGFGAMSAAKWQQGIDLLAKYHLVGKSFPASDIYATGFVAKS